MATVERSKMDPILETDPRLESGFVEELFPTTEEHEEVKETEIEVVVSDPPKEEEGAKPEEKKPDTKVEKTSVYRVI